MSNRIHGTKLMLRLGTPARDHWADITSWNLYNEEADSDVTTFADAAGGGARQWKLDLSAIQSTDTESFWSYVWANSGETVVFAVAPHGNSTATAAQPHFTGSLKIGPQPNIGGEAGTGAFTFDSTHEVQGTPTKTDS